MDRRERYEAALRRLAEAGVAFANALVEANAAGRGLELESDDLPRFVFTNLRAAMVAALKAAPGARQIFEE